jgi:hypothetical protein
VSKKSEIAAAIPCALLRYSEDGHIEIDNNGAEHALRAVALEDRIPGASGPPPPTD